MVHLGALPGTPLNKLSVSDIARVAIEEAILYQEAGLDAILLENMHDIPYLNKQVGPEITSATSSICTLVKQKINLPLGLQVLAGANKEALAIAHACDFEFIRAEGFVFAHVADEGLMESCAGELLRYRKSIGADRIKILTDIKKKHSSHAITADVSLEESVKAAEFFLSDGAIITGNSTGEAVEPKDLAGLKSNTSLPIIIGSGIDDKNISEYWLQADIFIVGSHFKVNGNWKNSVDPKRVSAFMKNVKKLRT